MRYPHSGHGLVAGQHLVPRAFLGAGLSVLAAFGPADCEESGGSDSGRHRKFRYARFAERAPWIWC